MGVEEGGWEWRGKDGSGRRVGRREEGMGMEEGVEEGMEEGEKVREEGGGREGGLKDVKRRRGDGGEVKGGRKKEEGKGKVKDR